ncbi:GxxExxY protein [Pedobacter sp. ISL-68]|uniref:GxxExxY protein n=1 Tax=unclassified Pedobacter TaxID=2628915 RepID=UPI001BE6450D|nr:MULTISPECIES: GxxExxY protein [unclassified Pedobacter]MBT2563217.1 GxxExxY protein [Pedobacter sp. ISL-64]MBT2591419.1 GxxExxY protein [Pedobacter sp. ISL-68]
MDNLNEITEKIIGAAYKVSNTLGSSFLEKVYENALFIEIKKAGLIVAKQHALQVFYDDQVVGDYFVDLFIENEVVVELKTTKVISDIHQAQLMNYLIACNRRCGLIINFGKPRVKIKRMLNSYNL